VTEILLWSALVVAVIGLCLALDERDERADARIRNQARRVKR
jgi:hypothetical protein